MLVAALILATACGSGQAPGQEQATAPSPTAPVGQTQAQTATPTLSPTVVVASPVATVTPIPSSPTPCAYTTLPTLQHAWNADEIGCPITPGQSGVATAYLPFERGQMIWRQDNSAIYVFLNDGTWKQYDDLWAEGDPEFSCGEALSPPTPVRGFGRVWCDNPSVRESLGAATAVEIGDSGGSVQDYVNGLILLAPDGSTFVLAGETATWRRVLPGE